MISLTRRRVLSRIVNRPPYLLVFMYALLSYVPVYVYHMYNPEGTNRMPYLASAGLYLMYGVFVRVAKGRNGASSIICYPHESHPWWFYHFLWPLILVQGVWDFMRGIAAEIDHMEDWIE